MPLQAAAETRRRAVPGRAGSRAPIGADSTGYDAGVASGCVTVTTAAPSSSGMRNKVRRRESLARLLAETAADPKPLRYGR